MNSKVSKGLWGMAAFLSVGVAGYAYWSVSAGGPPAPEVRANLFANPWLIVHMALGGTALLVGPLQLLPALRRRRAVHRWLGRIYLVGCLVGGIAGLTMAFGTTAGPMAAMGFGSLAVVWLTTYVQGWRMARAKRFDVHRAWMLRSFALTFGAVMLRVYLPLSQIMGIAFADAYTMIAWLAWVPNLMIVELYLRRGAFHRQQLA